MTAWLAVRCDPDHYGEMVLYRLPKDKHIPGPMQVESLIAQNPGISEAYDTLGASWFSGNQGKPSYNSYGRFILVCRTLVYSG